MKRTQASIFSSPSVPASIETTLPAAQTSRSNKSSFNSTDNRFNQRLLRAHQGSIQPRLTSQGLVISNQTLNQPLNPNAFLPGALKYFSKSRPQIVNMQNQRKYPQLSNDFLKTGCNIHGCSHGFQVENCRSPSEYLHCFLCRTKCVQYE